MQLTSISLITKDAWRQVEQLVLSLLGKVEKNWPLRLNFKRGFSETTTLIEALILTRVASLVSSRQLLLIPHLLLGLLEALVLFKSFFVL